MALCGERKIGFWSEEEDAKLRKLVDEHGTTSWAIICRFIPGRSGKSCRLRWYNQISPEINHGPFSSEEDEMIIAMNVNHDNKWASIAQQLPGRTENSVKNRWYTRLQYSSEQTVGHKPNEMAGKRLQQKSEQTAGHKPKKRAGKRKYSKDAERVETDCPSKKANMEIRPGRVETKANSEIRPTCEAPTPRSSNFIRPSMEPSSGSKDRSVGQGLYDSGTKSHDDLLGSFNIDLNLSATDTESLKDITSLALDTSLEGNNFDAGMVDLSLRLSLW